MGTGNPNPHRSQAQSSLIVDSSARHDRPTINCDDMFCCTFIFRRRRAPMRQPSRTRGMSPCKAPFNRNSIADQVFVDTADTSHNLRLPQVARDGIGTTDSPMPLPMPVPPPNRFSAHMLTDISRTEPSLIRGPAVIIPSPAPPPFIHAFLAEHHAPTSERELEPSGNPSVRHLMESGNPQEVGRSGNVANPASPFRVQDDRNNMDSQYFLPEEITLVLLFDRMTPEQRFRVVQLLAADPFFADVATPE
jgi:hypothetical protein